MPTVYPGNATLTITENAPVIIKETAMTTRVLSVELPTGGSNTLNQPILVPTRGRVLEIVAGEDIVRGELVYIDNSGSNIEKAYVATNDQIVSGIWYSDSTLFNETGYLQLDGFFEEYSWAWTVGQYLYNNGAGALTSTAPDYNIEAIAIAVTSTGVLLITSAIRMLKSQEYFIIVPVDKNIYLGSSGQGAIELKNGANPQVLNIYAKSGSFYERLQIAANTNSNFTITPQKNTFGIVRNVALSAGKFLVGGTYREATNDISLESAAVRSIGIERNTTNNTEGKNLTIKAGGTSVNGVITVLASSPTAGGTGYIVGDILTISTGGTGGQCQVVGVSAGVVTSVALVAGGSGYTTGAGKATTGGTGTSCTVDITTVLASTDKNGGDLILQSGVATGTGYSSIKLQTVTAGASGTADRTPATILELGDGKMARFGVSTVGQQTSGADLTNNVSSGGTDDQIDNWTDMTTYATDAAAIRNAIYQLARKLKQINDGLRNLGDFT